MLISLHLISITQGLFEPASFWRKIWFEAVFSYPVYLEPDVDDFLSKLAEQKKVDVQDLVNNLLRADVRLIQSVQE